VFKVPFINYTKGYPYIWCILKYTFTYESDWKAAEKLILDAARDEEIVVTARRARQNLEEITAKLAIKIDNTEPKVCTRTGASGVELSMRFLAHPRRRLDLMDKINRRILEAVDKEAKIEFAYSTNRIITSPHRGAAV
jgi:small-conductance mechanosensitive channel